MNLLFQTLALASLLATPTPSADERGDQLLGATRKGDLSAVRKLLDEGADVNTRTRYASTPLFFACDRGHVEIARLLIARGADVNVKDNFYNATALTWAMSKKHDELVALLVEHGVDVSEALNDAISEGDLKVFQLILDKGKLDQEMLDTGLLTATVLKSEKNEGMAKQLQEKGARPVNVALDEATLRGYEGQYSESGTNLTFAVKDSALNFVTSQASTPVHPRARDRFRFVQQGFDFVFERDGEGRVVAVRFPSRGGDLRLKKVN